MEVVFSRKETVLTTQVPFTKEFEREAVRRGML